MSLGANNARIKRVCDFFSKIQVNSFKLKYDGIIIPGGGAPERLRLHGPALEFVKTFWQTGRPVASICHGPQVLISARVLEGVTLTCVAGIRDDAELAGGHYVDEAVHVDGQLISSRKPDDLPAFCAKLVEAFAG